MRGRWLVPLFCMVLAACAPRVTSPPPEASDAGLGEEAVAVPEPPAEVPAPSRIVGPVPRRRPARPTPVVGKQERPAPPPRIGFEEVRSRARMLAVRPYVPPRETPAFLRAMRFEDWLGIDFREEYSLTGPGLPFAVQFYHPGSIYRTYARVHEVTSDGVTEARYAPAEFVGLDGSILDDLERLSLGFAGFRVVRAGTGDWRARKMATFLGATYFRGVSDGGGYGISAFGLTVDGPGVRPGEDYPRFTDFWIVRPRAKDEAVSVFALMNAPSLAGAYAFLIVPGTPMVMDVRCVLFARRGASSVTGLGIAPLAAMFLGDEDGKAAHMADTAFLNAHGTAFVSPLVNPRHMDVVEVRADDPLAFGLIQRNRDAFTAVPNNLPGERPPSVRVEPKGEWGRGRVRLTALPTGNPVNNNVLVSWHPDEPRIFDPLVDDDDPVSYAYRLIWKDGEVTRHSLARAVRTTARPSRDGTGVDMAVTFEGGPLAGVRNADRLLASVTLPSDVMQTGRTLERLPDGRWVLRFSVRMPRHGGFLDAILPNRNRLPNLRFEAWIGDMDAPPKPLTERWIYELRR